MVWNGRIPRLLNVFAFLPFSSSPLSSSTLDLHNKEKFGLCVCVFSLWGRRVLRLLNFVAFLPVASPPLCFATLDLHNKKNFCLCVCGFLFRYGVGEYSGCSTSFTFLPFPSPPLAFHTFDLRNKKQLCLCVVVFVLLWVGEYQGCSSSLPSCLSLLLLFPLLLSICILKIKRGWRVCVFRFLGRERVPSYFPQGP